MSTFSQALGNTAYTENGALSNATVDPTGKTAGRINLFYQAVRGLDVTKFESLLNKSSQENLIDTIVLVFNLRDIRTGKGERLLGRQAFKWLDWNYHDVMSKLIEYIPRYGRWDDLFVLWPKGDSTSPYVKYMADQLVKDKENMMLGRPISLCAKWAPSESSSLDKKHGLVKTLIECMGITRKEYRQEYLTPLRSYLVIVEKFMCSKQWNMIDFNRVPSCAMKRLRKAFKSRTPDTFQEWIDGLATGKTKVNAKVLMPHEVCMSLRCGIHNKDTTLIEAQWKVIQEQASENVKLRDMLTVVDVSGSMSSWGIKNLFNFTPLDVSCALGLIVSNSVQGPFRDHVITFSEKPSFIVLSGETLVERYKQLSNMDWGQNTDLMAVFNLVLSKSKQHGLTNDQMPKTILIISDMQFDQACTKNSNTNFEQIKVEYSKYGYTLPRIIFWNVSTRGSDSPVTVMDNGTALISGFSPNILRNFIQDGDINPYKVVRNTIDSKDYTDLKAYLTGLTYSNE